MTKIICATDFSPAADQAAAIAFRLAQAFGDELQLLHVVPRSPFLHPELVASALRPLVDAAQKELERRAGRLASERVRLSSQAFIGDVVGCLEEAAADPDTRMLVLGSHGRKGAARFLVGSVAERTVRAAGCPVLVVPEAAVRMRHFEPATPLVITAGVDLSPATDAALRWLQALTRAIPCQVNLVHLYCPPRESFRLGLPWIPGELPGTDPEVAAVIERELRLRVAKVWPGEEARLRVRPTWVFDAEPLVKEAETDGADLLVVGTRQHRGSLAVATVRASTLPMVSIPAPPQPVAEAEPLRPLRTVLVPTDFHPDARGVVREACRLLQPIGGTVILCHGRATDDRQTREQLEAALLALMPPDAVARQIYARPLIQESGPPAEAILQAARRVAADAIVMSAGGRGPLSRALLGSTTESVVRHATVPVTVVPSLASR
jgi:nucleotide-binding universal stress UspA family protein